jgi:hypothetical protein
MILPFVTRRILKVPARRLRRRKEGGENCALAIAERRWPLRRRSNARRPILKSSFQAPHKTPTLRWRKGSRSFHFGFDDVVQLEADLKRAF